jgi:hypothetical protein
MPNFPEFCWFSGCIFPKSDLNLLCPRKWTDNPIPLFYLTWRKLRHG